MKNLPTIYKAHHLLNPNSVYRDTQIEASPGLWRYARPMAYVPPVAVIALIRRFRLAWHVFTGKYDALDWEND